METVILKSGEKRYRSMVWINGRGIKSPLFKRKTDATEWKSMQAKSKREAKLYGEHYNLGKDISLEEYSIKWLEQKSTLARSTVLNYSRALRVHVLPLLGKKQLRSIRRDDGEFLIQNLKKTNHNAKGTNNIMMVFKSLMIEAKNDGYILQNPLEGLSKLSSDPRPEVYWTKAEIDQFLRSTTFGPYYCLYIIALNTGMRRGELAGLCWDRIDFTTNQITITRTRDGHELKETTKTKIRRMVPMNQIVRTTLLHLMKKQMNPKFVFTELDSSPLEVHHFYRRFQQDQIKAGLTNTIRFHDLRHTFASQFMMSGGNVFDLQKILGHTKIEMTMRYAHLSPEHLHNAIKIVSFGEGIESNFNQYLTNDVHLLKSVQ